MAYLVVSYGPAVLYKSQAIHFTVRFTWFLVMSYGPAVFYKSQAIHFTARFTWFLVVSYGLSVFTIRRISFSCKIYLVSFGFLWLSCAYKSKGIHFAARFTWFPVVSYGLPVLASMVLNCFQLPIGDYKSLESHLGFRWPNQKKPGKSLV